MSGSFPMPYPGTDAELDDNMQSHDFNESYEPPTCQSCGCKRGGPTSYWPCGTIPDFVGFERSPFGGQR